ncbi:MAG: HIT family protein [bacterium]
MSDDCVFCKIAAGMIPSVKVHEDEHVLVFMDIGPVTKGHSLVIPKAHHDPIINVPVSLLQKVIAVVQQVARAQLDGLGADGVNVTQANGEIAGQVIPHVHFHVIPRFKDDPHSWTCPQRKYDSDEEMGQYAARIKNAMKG